MSDKQRVLQLLGLARRAGRLTAGTTKILSLMERGRIDLLILAADLSPASRERLLRAARTHAVRTVVAFDREQLGAATGYPGKAVFALTGEDFARTVLKSWTDGVKVDDR